MQVDIKEEIEIDFKELFYVLLRKIWVILFIGVICAIGSGLVSKLVIKPIYTSTAKIYVMNRQNTEKATTLSDLQTGTQLTKDYMILIKSRPVTEQVISNLSLDMTHEQLFAAITVNTPADTRILEINVQSTDPYIAKQLADSIAEVSSERMVSIMEMEKANIVEEGNIPNTPSSPNVMKNIILAGFLGSIVTIVIILLLYLVNDSIRTTDDIERYLGLTALGTILFEDTENTKKSKAKHNKPHRRNALKGGNTSNATT